MKSLQQFYSRPRAEVGSVETVFNDFRELPPPCFAVEKRELLSGVLVLPVQFGWEHLVKNHSADGGEDRFALPAIFREKQLDAVVQFELPCTMRGDDFFRMRVAAVIPRFPANLIKERGVAVLMGINLVKQLRVRIVFWERLGKVTRSEHHIQFGDSNRSAVRRLQDVMAAEHQQFRFCLRFCG